MWPTILALLAALAMGKIGHGIALSKQRSAGMWGIAGVLSVFLSYLLARVLTAAFLLSSRPHDEWAAAVGLSNIALPLLAGSCVVLTVLRLPELEARPISATVEDLEDELSPGRWDGEFKASRRELDFGCELSLSRDHTICLQRTGSEVCHTIARDQLVSAAADGETLRLHWKDEHGEFDGRFCFRGELTRQARIRCSDALEQWIAIHLTT